MEITASLKQYRQSPRKVRLVANLIRGKKAMEAVRELDFTIKRSSAPLKKLLLSALANAENNFKLNKEDLYIKSIKINAGQTLKRSMPRAFGRAYPIKKRTSHIDIVLDIENKKK